FPLRKFIRMSINSGLRLYIGNFIRGHDFRFRSASCVGCTKLWSCDYLVFATRRLPLQFRPHETSDLRNHRAGRRGIRWLVLLESFPTTLKRSGECAAASRNNFSSTSAGL